MSGDNQKQGPLSRYSPNSAYLWRDCGVFVWSHMVCQVVEIIRRQPSRPLIVLTQERDSLVEQEGQSLRLTLTPTPSEVPDSMAIPTSQNPGHEYRTQSRTMLSSTVTEHEVDILVSSGYLWENGQAIAEWKRDAYGRMIWAAACPFILNIMTVGSAFSFDFVVPSIGLGCRSGGVLLYWMVSYIVLITLVLATSISDQWSAHEARFRRYQTQVTVLFRAYYRLLGVVAVSLRLFGKMLACVNSLWIILHCLFELTSFYDRCYCLTNRGTAFWLFHVKGRRVSEDIQRLWIGFASGTSVTCLAFIAFMLVWTAKQL